MVGKSTCGNGDTGSNRNATMPASATAAVKRVVPTELRIHVSERLTSVPYPPFTNRLSARKVADARIAPRRLPTRRTAHLGLVSPLSHKFYLAWPSLRASVI